MQAAAYQLDSEGEKALQQLSDALVLAEPGGYVRHFVDEGATLAQLLREAAVHGLMPDYVRKLLVAFRPEANTYNSPPTPSSGALLEPLIQRELDVLHLIAQGLSNRDIAEQLFRALNTVKGHNRSIYGKLQVSNRTEAVARARELRLL